MEQLNSCTQTVDFVNQGNDTSVVDVKKMNMKMEVRKKLWKNNEW